jgi:hypothetical protein
MSAHHFPLGVTYITEKLPFKQTTTTCFFLPEKPAFLAPLTWHFTDREGREQRGKR